MLLSGFLTTSCTPIYSDKAKPAQSTQKWNMAVFRRALKLLLWLSLYLFILFVAHCHGSRSTHHVFKVKPKQSHDNGLGHFSGFLPRHFPIPASGPSRKHNDIGSRSWTSSSSPWRFRQRESFDKKVMDHIMKVVPLSLSFFGPFFFLFCHFVEAKWKRLGCYYVHGVVGQNLFGDWRTWVRGICWFMYFTIAYFIHEDSAACSLASFEEGNQDEKI